MKQKRRIISLVMASLLMFSMTATALPPLEQTDMTEALYRSNVITPILSASLSHSFEDAVIANESTWIPLHDTEGTEYAYFVPLCNEKGMITGFSVIGNINGNHSTLFNRNNTMPDEFAMAIISAYQNRNTGDKIIYSFPYVFIIGQEGSYRRIYADGTIKTISEIDNYLSTSAERLASSAYSFSEAQLDPDLIAIYGQLDHWAVHDFVPVNDNGYKYYGGLQHWLEDEGYGSDVYQACALTASANAFYYMSQYVSGKANLYSRSGITKSAFSSFQKDLRENGFSFGLIPGAGTPGELEEYACSWADYRGVPLSVVKSNSSFTPSMYFNLISDGLQAERPVLLLTYNSPFGRIDWHWITVTRLYDPNDGGGERIVVSNTGVKEEYSFDEWAHSATLYKGAAYFE